MKIIPILPLISIFVVSISINADLVLIPGGASSGGSLYMDTTEVSKELWDDVYNWAVLHGYSFENPGLGIVGNHPVHSISWYDCLKWCNARSQMEERTPCYTFNGNVYKTGEFDPICNFSANGFRLPTNTEWEFAARGNLIGKRFPWGDTISHDQANYFADNTISYDISPTEGHHPLHGSSLPYTSPVGRFSTNGYGLYDMAGNVREWCWDTSGNQRCIKDGGWNRTAVLSRCNHENWAPPDHTLNDRGFRTVSSALIGEIGLIAYYPFDGTANDASGNLRHGTVNGTIALAEDRFGQSDSCYHFEGDARIELPPLDSVSGFTISLWAYNAFNSSSHGDKTLFCMRKSNARNECTLQWEDGSDDLNLGNYNLYGQGTIFSSGLGYFNPKWKLYTVTYNDGTAKLFVDGTQVIDEVIDWDTTDFQQMYLGKRLVDNGPSNYDYFAGKIDDVRIYDRALSSSEIAQVYAENKHLEYITITGPTNVLEGTVTNYSCTAYFADGTSVDVSELAEWSIGNDYWTRSDLNRSQFTSGYASDNPVYIDVEYGGNNRACRNFIAVMIQPKMRVDIRKVSSTPVLYPPGRYIVEIEAVTYNANSSTLSYAWDLDNDGEKDDATTPSLLIGNVLPGEYKPVSVEVVANQSGITATANYIIPITKDPVENETPLSEAPINLISNRSLYNVDHSPFNFVSNRIDNGFIVITHGLNDSVLHAKNNWVAVMGSAIETDPRLNAKSPNICLYDWSKTADISSITGKGPTGIFNLQDLRFIRPFGLAHGQDLADWIKSQIAIGNINTDKPIHIIGHSAGGFVAGMCASIRKNQITQITMLDTPFPYYGIWSQYLPSPSNGLVESYMTIIGGPVIAPDYAQQTYNLDIVELPPTFMSLHSWAHEWYTHNTINNEQRHNGFYYSPFITPNDFHGYNPDEFSALAIRALAESDATISSMLITNFNSFGDVVHNDPQYTIAEAANAGIYKELALPIGVQHISFDYQFISLGDGDFLSVHWGTNYADYIGLDLSISRDEKVEGIIPLTEYAGTTNMLTFKLVSRNDTNAVLSISNIVMEVSSDPDGDGLDTDAETLLGTDPLKWDSDKDGVSDGDEINNYYTNPNLKDSDSDGLADGEEIRCGTSPTNAMDLFDITSLTANTNQKFTISWSSVSGKQYDVQRSTTLPMDNYTTLADGVYATEPTNTFVDVTATNDVHFYRIKLKE